MTVHFKRMAILATLLSIPVGVAVAQDTRPWGWRHAPRGYGYFSGAEVDRGKVDAAVKETLSKATKGQIWATPAGVKHTPILIDNQIVGQCWEDCDPKTLIIGAFWAGPWGVNVELVKDGKVVGMIWVKVPPPAERSALPILEEVHMRRSLAALIFLICTPGLGLAWGESGHRTVAEIAARYLSEQTAAEVQNLLGGGPHAMADVSVWADEIRNDERPETYYWHVVEIPPDGIRYDRARDCKIDDCIVEKIKEFVQVLRRPNGRQAVANRGPAIPDPFRRRSPSAAPCVCTGQSPRRCLGADRRDDR